MHRAHLTLARRAQDQLELDEVWFLPARHAPHKPGAPGASADDRCQMLGLAMAGHPDWKVCEVELQAPPGQRSVDTLRTLREGHPGLDFFFLMGEDSFWHLPQWKEPEELVKMAPPVVMARPPGGRPRLETVFGHPVHWLEGEAVELSSTSLRRRLRAGKACPELPEAVQRYLREHGLYLQNSPDAEEGSQR